MSAFGADAVERLDFDFTSFPRGDGQPGNCTGKGYVPEPTEAAILRLIAAQKALEGLDDADTNLLEPVRASLADFCAGHPSAEEIAQLPPRVLLAFARWLSESLAPKA